MHFKSKLFLQMIVGFGNNTKLDLNSDIHLKFFNKLIKTKKRVHKIQKKLN